MSYENDIKRMQIEHDLEAARIVREGKSETVAALKLIEERRARRQIDKAPPKGPLRKCDCGKPLEKRARYCKRCRDKNRLKTKSLYQQKYRQAGRSTVKQKRRL